MSLYSKLAKYSYEIQQQVDKIDLVYTYIDGSDPKFIEKKEIHGS